MASLFLSVLLVRHGCPRSHSRSTRRRPETSRKRQSAVIATPPTPRPPTRDLPPSLRVEELLLLRRFDDEQGAVTHHLGEPIHRQWRRRQQQETYCGLRERCSARPLSTRAAFCCRGSAFVQKTKRRLARRCNAVAQGLS